MKLLIVYDSEEWIILGTLKVFVQYRPIQRGRFHTVSSSIVLISLLKVSVAHITISPNDYDHILDVKSLKCVNAYSPNTC